MKWRLFLLISLVGACLTDPARASEGFMYGGITGGADIGSAYLPPSSGFYGILMTDFVNGSAIYGNDAREETAARYGVHVATGVAGIMYVYPFKLAGGTLATTLIDEAGEYHMTAYGRSGYVRGVADLYSDLLSWSKHIGGGEEDGHPGKRLPYGLTVKLAYSMIFPTGQYNVASPWGSPGHNVFFFIPNASFSYLTQPNLLGDGTEFSLTIWYDIATKNHANNYQTGDVVDFDWAVSERIGKWQVGLAGNYATQVADDRINGVPVNGNGNRLGAATIGPVIAYQIPAWKSLIKLKVALPIWQRNYNRVTTVLTTFVKEF